MTLSRRTLLSGGVAVGAIARLSRSVPAQTRRKTIVRVSRGRSHEKGIALAVERMPLLARVRRGDTVLLKVNTNSADPYPYSTSPVMVEVVASRLRDLGAKVIVGDRSFWGDPNTRRNLEDNGIGPAARKASAKVVAFEDDMEWIPISSNLVSHWKGSVRVPRLVQECDHRINLPCVKTHFISTYTMALKNILGLVHPKDRARPGNLRTHDPKRLYDQIADIHRFVSFDAHVLDGFQALISGGPTPGSGAPPTIVSTGLLIESEDPVATDIVGISLLLRHSPKSERVTQFSPWNNPMIQAAIQAKIGIYKPSQLHVVGPE